MKKIIAPLLFALIISSCGEKTDNREGYVFEFYPKKVTSVWFGVRKKNVVETNGYTNINYQSILGSDSVKGDSLVLSVFTYNVSKAFISNPNLTNEEISYYYYKYLDSSLPSVEEQIEDDYRKAHSKTKSSSENVYASLIEIAYRTTEISDMTIYSLNTSLFGKKPGESLNDFFDIEKYEPSVIFNAPTQTLLYGYSSKSYPVSIGEWLSLSPLASVGMYLVPNTKIDNLPVSVQFVVKMETADGLVLRDTTRMITITE